MQSLANRLFYVEKQPGESEKDRLSRRMAYKFPVVVRYSLLVSGLIGLMHCLLARKLNRLVQHMAVSPLYMMFLCHEEIRAFLQ
jgi:hypothetical protein